jgi:hypothetical protein
MSTAPAGGGSEGAAPPPVPQQSLQVTVRKGTDAVERRSPIIFAIVGLCFMLPFISFSCGGQRLTTMSGADLVRGAKVSVDQKAFEGFEDAFNQTGTDTTDATTSGVQSEDTDPELWAIVALAAAVIGLVVGFTRGRFRTLASLIAAGIGFVAMILLRFSLSGSADIPKEAQGLIAFEYRLGYWLVILGFLLLALAHGLTFRSPRTSLYPPAGTPDPA